MQCTARCLQRVAQCFGGYHTLYIIGIFKFRMLPNGKKSNALRAEILGPCGGNLKEEIFP